MLFVVCMTIQKVVKSFSIKEQKALKTATNPHSRGLNRPFSLVDFIFPLQIIWRYPGEYFLSKFDILMIKVLAGSLFKEKDHGSNLLGHMICIGETKSTSEKGQLTENLERVSMPINL